MKTSVQEPSRNGPKFSTGVTLLVRIGAPKNETGEVGVKRGRGSLWAF